MRLSGARVLITGASSGIGRALAYTLGDAGCSLLLTGRDTVSLDKVAAVTGADVVDADLCEPAGLSALLSAAAVGPAPDLVVLCAGIGHYASAVDDDDAGVERLLATNLLAPIRLSRALLPAMLERGSGRLVFVTSIAGVLGVAGESAYAASKAALGTFAASLRAELAGSGVGVTTVIPGVVDTKFFERRGTGYHRRFPRPVPAQRVAAAVRRAVEKDRTQVVVPGWLRVPIAVQACAPQTYAGLAGRSQ